MDYPLSKEEFTSFYIDIGVKDFIDIEMGYRLYLALVSKDSEKIKIAENNIYWNHYLRYQGRLN